MRTYTEAQQLETADEVQFMRPTARLRCDIARCRERATHLIGRAQTGRSNLWAICDKHAEELAKNLPEHLLPFVPHPENDSERGDNAATGNTESTHTNQDTQPQTNIASQASADGGDGSAVNGGQQSASTAPEYVRECCGQTFTDKDEYRKHRRYDCKEKANA